MLKGVKICEIFPHIMLLLMATIISSIMFICSVYTREVLPPIAALYTNIENNCMQMELPDTICLYSTEIAHTARESETEGIEVNVIITAGNWDSVVIPKMASGTFYEDHSIDEEKQFVVIDSTLATKLFFSTDVVGRDISLDGTVYTISGVIDESKNLLSQFCSNGLPTIYREHTAIDTPSMEGLFALGIGEMGESQFREYIFPLLEQELPEGHFENYRLTNDIIDLYVETTILIVLVNLFFVSKNLIKKVWIKECCAKKILLWISGIGMWSGVIYGGWNIVVSIPTAFLPNDNIFDVSHYFEIWINQIQSAHLYDVLYPMDLLSHIIMGIVFALSFNILVFGIMTFVSVKQWSKMGEN